MDIHGYPWISRDIPEYPELQCVNTSGEEVLTRQHLAESSVTTTALTAVRRCGRLHRATAMLAA
eukprot:4015855-Prymnesium_polylepis.1